MMKKYSSIGLSILLLAGLIVAAALWIRVFYASIEGYRSPLRAADLNPAASLPAHTDQVVLVVVSGLGYDAAQALNLPVLEQLKRAGADVAVESTPPTYAQTAWATLITGAPPDTNDAPPLDLARTILQPLAIDTIFARAQAAGVPVAVMGRADWGRLIPRPQLDHSFFVNEAGPEADAAIFDAALPLIENSDARLIVIQFTQVDFAAHHQGGASSEAYQRAAQRIDAYLDQIRQAMNLNHSVLLILSDYGHIPDGGHGGDEVEVIWQPLVMIGENIIPGAYSDIHQTDIAPTLAALLGLPTPSAAQGRVLFEMLQLTRDEQTIIQLSQAQQRVALAQAYAAALQSRPAVLPDSLLTDLAHAQASFISNNIDGALQLALLAQQEADTSLAAVKNRRLQTEQFSRLIVALVVFLIWFVSLWRRRGFHAGSIVITSLLVIVMYHALYQLQGHSYSLSSLNNFSELPFEVARRTAVSLLAGGGLLFIFLLMTQESDWLTLLGTGYGFGILVTFIFAAPLFWTYWQNGFVADWRLPAVLPAFWQITSLFTVMSAAILGLLLPWPMMTLGLFVHLLRRRLTARRTQVGSDVLPGLRL
ncbi:MAG: alkaline phosphatase family protein [Chloroflexota bacterium]